MANPKDIRLQPQCNFIQDEFGQFVTGAYFQQFQSLMKMWWIALWCTEKGVTECTESQRILVAMVTCLYENPRNLANKTKRSQRGVFEPP